MNIINIQNNLANKLLEYEKDVNYHEYCDNYNNDEEAFEDILKTLRSSEGIQHVLFALQNDIDNYEGYYKDEPNNTYVKDILSKVKNLFKDVRDYQREMINMECGR